MPEVGEIQKASDIGYKGSQKYIRVICPICEKGRWICFSHTQKPEHTGICKQCYPHGLENHPQWRGGQHVNSYGYVMIKRLDHPHADSNGYVKRSRIVLENKLGRSLWPNADVHHKNGIKTDDSPDNLIELFHDEHQSLHMRQRSELATAK